MKRQIKLPKPYVKTLDGYIIKKFLGTYVFAIVLILAIIVMFDINEKLDSFMKAPVKATIFAAALYGVGIGYCQLHVCA